jgi:hypothetical protein
MFIRVAASEPITGHMIFVAEHTATWSRYNAPRHLCPSAYKTLLNPCQANLIHLFICGLFNDVMNSLSQVARHPMPGWSVNNREGFERKGHRLIWGTVPIFSWRNWRNQWKYQSRQSVPGLRFESGPAPPPLNANRGSCPLNSGAEFQNFLVVYQFIYYII